jgi:hypothetical protein
VQATFIAELVKGEAALVETLEKLARANASLSEQSAVLSYGFRANADRVRL